MLAKKKLLYLKVQQPPLVAAESNNVEVGEPPMDQIRTQWFTAEVIQSVHWLKDDGTGAASQLVSFFILAVLTLQYFCLCLNNKTCLLMTLRPQQSSSHLLVVLNQPSKLSSTDKLHFLWIILNSTLLFLHSKSYSYFLCWQSDKKDTIDVQPVVSWTCWNGMTMTAARFLYVELPGSSTLSCQVPLRWLGFLFSPHQKRGAATGGLWVPFCAGPRSLWEGTSRLVAGASSSQSQPDVSLHIFLDFFPFHGAVFSHSCSFTLLSRCCLQNIRSPENSMQSKPWRKQTLWAVMKWTGGWSREKTVGNAISLTDCEEQ